MQIYLAPLQGFTDWIFRESFSQHVGTFDKTFTPFIRVQQGVFFRPGQCNDILPANNRFQHPVPQFLGNDATSFQRFEELCVLNGYSEVNINMGCPFPIVVKKGMGAGLLSQPEQIKRLLESIFAKTKLNVSIKCRLGNDSVTEFEQLIPVFNNFPLHELIIHPRLGKQQYSGEVNFNAFMQYLPELKHPVCYNGDMLSFDDVSKMEQNIPQLERIMIGRGILQQPFLLSEIRRENLSQQEKQKILRNFHLSVLENCRKKYSGDLHFLNRLVELWMYHHHFFEDGNKLFKKIKKCKTIQDYEDIVLKAINDLC